MQGVVVGSLLDRTEAGSSQRHEQWIDVAYLSGSRGLHSPKRMNGQRMWLCCALQQLDLRAMQHLNRTLSNMCDVWDRGPKEQACDLERRAMTAALVWDL